MLSDIPRHAREVARRRLLETFSRRGDVRFPDLLHYLEHVAVEPDGEDAFRLSRVLKELMLDDERRRQLLAEARHWGRSRAARDGQRQVQQWLSDAEHALNARPRGGSGAASDLPTPSIGGTGAPASPAPSDELRHQPGVEPEPESKSDAEARERYSAQVAGERIGGLIRSEQRLELRCVFAALAVAWLFISPPPAATELYMDRAVCDLFPW